MLHEAMTPPLVGLTTSHTTSQSGLAQVSLTEAYVNALVHAGAAPILIPIGLPETTLQAIIHRLDGIVFTGGGDVHPDRYASQMHPLVDDIDPSRDQAEIQLIHNVCKENIPFLGICRGLQVINVALGGTLYEDILDQRPNSQRHQYSPGWSRNHLAHEVQIQSGSHLAEILGTKTASVNSFHHQGIRELANGLRATAVAPDGLIEAIELPGHPFALAVQWHPEWLTEDEAMQRLFRELVHTAETVSLHQATI